MGQMKKIIPILLACAMPIPTVALGQVDPFSAHGSAGQRSRGGVISSVEFVDAPITTVFKMISDLTGWSIIMSPALSEKPPKINLWIKNLSPDEALERIASVGGLMVQRKGNVVEVMSFDEYAKIHGVEKRVVQLKNASAKELAPTLQPLVDKDQSKILADTESNKLILLVPQPLLDSLLQLIQKLDVPFEKDSIRVIPLKHLEASVLAPKLQQFLSQSIAGGSSQLSFRSVNVSAGDKGQPAVTAQSAESKRAGEGWIVQFMVEPKLNVIVLRGLPGDVAQTEALIEKLDVNSAVSVVSYPLQYTNARDVYQTIQDLLDTQQQQQTGWGQGQSDQTPRLKVALSQQNNQIIVEGSKSDHQRMAQIIATIDKPLPPGSGGMRVYRLENSTAQEVAQVINSIIQQRTQGGGLAQQQRSSASGSLESGKMAPPSEAPSGASSPRPSTPGVAAPPPPAGGAAPLGGAIKSEGGGGANQLSAGDVLPPQVTAAPQINAVIIRASAVEQEEFAALIHELDKPRQQVMLEVTLVSVRSSQTFNLGVELAAAGIRSGGPNVVGFSTFGVGQVNTTNGALSFANPPPIGLNFGVFKSEDFSLVLNALKTVGDTRITSAPRILVEDNAPGQIKQLSQEPYAVASQGTSTTITSFGGYAEAGATLSVTPHLAQNDWLRLEYTVDLSSFDQRTAEQLAANLPPPIRQNESKGTVRLPSDATVVLGGLVSTNDDKTKSGIPFLSDIPLLGYLFSSHSNNWSNETLFIFIRPIILRDLAFRDLKYLSESDLQAAQLSQKQYPQNQLKLILPRSQEVR